MSASRYAFLLDENALGLAKWFPHGRAVTVASIGLIGASDDAVLDAASRSERIIITVNGDDFVTRFEKRALAASRSAHVADVLAGLVIVSDDFAKRWNRGTLQDIERRMRLNGNPVTWHDVFAENLCVRVRVDLVAVQYFPCRHCSGTEDGFTDETRPTTSRKTPRVVR